MSTIICIHLISAEHLRRINDYIRCFAGNIIQDSEEDEELFLSVLLANVSRKDYTRTVKYVKMKQKNKQVGF